MLQAVAAPLPQALDWLRQSASSGQVAQAELALALAACDHPQPDDTPGGQRAVLFDEFGSAWDDSTSMRVGRALTCWVHARPAPPRVVLASCHIAFARRAGLHPDWVYEAASARCFWFHPPAGSEPLNNEVSLSAAVGGVDEKSGLEGWLAMADSQSGQASNGDEGLYAEGGVAVARHPRLQLRLRRCHPAAWARFREFHYKTPVISTVATAFLLEATIQSGTYPALYLDVL